MNGFALSLIAALKSPIKMHIWPLSSHFSTLFLSLHSRFLLVLFQFPGIPPWYRCGVGYPLTGELLHTRCHCLWIVYKIQKSICWNFKNLNSKCPKITHCIIEDCLIMKKLLDQKVLKIDYFYYQYALPTWNFAWALEIACWRFVSNFERIWGIKQY